MPAPPASGSPCSAPCPESTPARPRSSWRACWPMTSRVVLVGLASGDTAIRGISNEPSAPGLAELACGAASLRQHHHQGQILAAALDLGGAGAGRSGRCSRCARHGRELQRLGAQLTIIVIVDAGEAAGPEIERISEIAPHAVLVTDVLSNAATTVGAGSPAGLRIWRRADPCRRLRNSRRDCRGRVNAAFSRADG